MLNWCCDALRCWWLSFHIIFHGCWMNKTSSSFLFRNSECLPIFWIGTRAFIEIEGRDGVYVVWRFRSFSNIVLYYTYRLWMRASSINHCYRFERQEPTMKRRIEWKESKYKLMQNTTNSLRFYWWPDVTNVYVYCTYMIMFCAFGINKSE